MPKQNNRHEFLIRALNTNTNFDECWIWPFPLTPKGYGRYQTSRAVNKLVHRQAFELHYGVSLPDHILICHRCDNRACFNPECLFVGLNQDNMDDMNRKGRGNGGKVRPKNGRHFIKISEDDVREIRRLYNIEKKSQAEISKLFPNIQRQALWPIVHNISWKYVA